MTKNFLTLFVVFITFVLTGCNCDDTATGGTDDDVRDVRIMDRGNNDTSYNDILDVINDVSNEPDATGVVDTTVDIVIEDDIVVSDTAYDILTDTIMDTIDDIGADTITDIGIDVGCSFYNQPQIQWVKAFPITSESEVTVHSAAIDPRDESIVLVGGFIGKIDLGGVIAEGHEINSYAFVVKYNSEGKYLWHRSWGIRTGGSSPYGTGINSVAIDPEDGSIIFLGGGPASPGGYSLDFGGGPRYNPSFMVKLTSDGQYVWDTGWNAGGTLIRNPKDGGFIIAGGFQSKDHLKTDFGGGERTPEGWIDGFIAKFDKNGKYLWDVTFGSTSYDSVVYANLSPYDESIVALVYVAGKKIDFGGGEREASGISESYFLVKYDQSGKYKWDINLTKLNAPIKTFDFYSNENLITGGNQYVDQDTANKAVVGNFKTPSGIFEWQQIWNGEWIDKNTTGYHDNVLDVKYLKSESIIFAAGEMEGTINFGNTNIKSKGLTDAILVTYKDKPGDPKGADYLWHYTIGSPRGNILEGNDGRDLFTKMVIDEDKKTMLLFGSNGNVVDIGGTNIARGNFVLKLKFCE